MANKQYITCPCCGRKIAIIKDESVVDGLVFLNTMPSDDGLNKALEKAHIELAAARKRGNEAETKNCSVEQIR